MYILLNFTVKIKLPPQNKILKMSLFLPKFERKFYSEYLWAESYNTLIFPTTAAEKSAVSLAVLW